MRLPAFDPAVREALRDTWRGMCWRCGGVGMEYAHRRPRGVRDEHTACYCNACWLCRVCHSWCHRNPVASAQVGLTLSRYEEQPWTVPVQTIAGTVLLNCDRTVTYLGNS